MPRRSVPHAKLRSYGNHLGCRPGRSYSDEQQLDRLLANAVMGGPRSENSSRSSKAATAMSLGIRGPSSRMSLGAATPTRLFATMSAVGRAARLSKVCSR